jgi:hypothetical protein
LKPLLCYRNFRPPKRWRAGTRLRGLKNKGGKKPGFDLISCAIFSIFSLNAAEKSAWVQWALKAVDISTKNC